MGDELLEDEEKNILSQNDGRIQGIKSFFSSYHRKAGSSRSSSTSTDINSQEQRRSLEDGSSTGRFLGLYKKMPFIHKTSDLIEDVPDVIEEEGVLPSTAPSIIPSPHICKIFTPFGEAMLLSIRQEDHIYVAKLFSNGAMLYLHKDRVIFHNRCHPMGIGTEIHTLYGTGLVVHQRPTDFVFEIDLLQWKLSDGKYARLYIPQERIYEAGINDGRMSSIFKYTRQSMQTGGSKMKGGLSLVKTKLTNMAGRRTQQFELGERVLTPFGSGYIRAIRYDNAYVIKVRKLERYAYINPMSVAPFPHHLAHYVVENKIKESGKKVESGEKVKQVMRQVTGRNWLRNNTPKS